MILHKPNVVNENVPEYLIVGCQCENENSALYQPNVNVIRGNGRGSWTGEIEKGIAVL